MFPTHSYYPTLLHPCNIRATGKDMLGSFVSNSVSIFLQLSYFPDLQNKYISQLTEDRLRQIHVPYVYVSPHSCMDEAVASNGCT